MKKNQKEIQEQIDGLLNERSTVPEVSGMGNKNWEMIDAQIAVLKGDKNPDSFYIDETAEEFEEGDNDVYFAAEQAKEWLAGNKKSSLFSH